MLAVLAAYPPGKATPSSAANPVGIPKERPAEGMAYWNHSLCLRQEELRFLAVGVAHRSRTYRTRGWEHLSWRSSGRIREPQTPLSLPREPSKAVFDKRHLQKVRALGFLPSWASMAFFSSLDPCIS